MRCSTDDLKESRKLEYTTGYLQESGGPGAEEMAQWKHMEAFANRHPDMLGRALGGVAAIQQALGCSYETAVHVGLCFAPWHGADLDMWARAVADFVGLTQEQAEKLVALVCQKGGE